MHKYTAFFALAITANENIDLGRPAPSGVIPDIASVRVPIDNSGNHLEIPISAIKAVTKREFVDLVSRRAAEIYDSIDGIVDSKTSPLSNIAADPRIKEYLRGK